MQNQSDKVPLVPMQTGEYQGFKIVGAYDVGILKTVDRLLLSGQAGKALEARVIDPGSAEQVPAGVYWVRACVDRNILKELGRDPAAMTRKEYLRQGSSFNALCAAWVFEVEVAAEKKRKLRHVH